MSSYKIRVTMPHLSTSKCKALETSWTITAATNSIMEMGIYNYRFRGRISKVLAGSRCYMGNYSSTHQIGTFHCLKHNTFSGAFKPHLFATHHSFIWSACHYCVRSGFTFYNRFLEEFADNYGNSLNLSSTFHQSTNR